MLFRPAAELLINTLAALAVWIAASIAFLMALAFAGGVCVGAHLSIYLPYVKHRMTRYADPSARR